MPRLAGQVPRCDLRESPACPSRSPTGKRRHRIRPGMKPLAIVFLVLLLILVLLPLGMGMAMGCPLHATACSATIGMCAAILGTITLLLVSPLGFIRHRRLVLHDVLLVTTLDKPPRLP